MVKWGGHLVAIADGYVYDPMLGLPVLFINYPIHAFGTDQVYFEEAADTKYIKQKLKERRKK